MSTNKKDLVAAYDDHDGIVKILSEGNNDEDSLVQGPLASIVHATSGRVQIHGISAKSSVFRTQYVSKLCMGHTCSQTHACSSHHCGGPA